jgi:hypothetical protein
VRLYCRRKKNFAAGKDAEQKPKSGNAYQAKTMANAHLINAS